MTVVIYGAANFRQGGSGRISFRGAQATISHWGLLAVCPVPAYGLDKQIRFCDRTVDVLTQIKTSDQITPGGVHLITESKFQESCPAEKVSQGLGRRRASVTLLRSP
jgi:hypothetical protein